MENFSQEIINMIEDNNEENEESIKDILLYLYHTTTDDKMKREIVDWYNEHDYCISCGNKLSTYAWCETHTELEYNNQEWFSCKLCPCCDRAEIEDYMKEVK